MEHFDHSWPNSSDDDLLQSSYVDRELSKGPPHNGAGGAPKIGLTTKRINDPKSDLTIAFAGGNHEGCFTNNLVGEP